MEWEDTCALASAAFCPHKACVGSVDEYSVLTSAILPLAEGRTEKRPLHLTLLEIQIPKKAFVQEVGGVSLMEMSTYSQILPGAAICAHLLESFLFTLAC